MAVDSRLEARVKACLNFDDSRYFNKVDTHFNVLIQLHSIIRTNKGWVVLRGWRATKFGPLNVRNDSENWRITQPVVKGYDVPPNRVIGRAIQTLHIEYLLEISIFDEHQKSLEGLKSRDFVALQNVRAVTRKEGEKTWYHLWVQSGSSNSRGVSVVPNDFDNKQFQDFRTKCNEELAKIKDPEEFKGEFFVPYPGVNIEVDGEGTQEETKKELKKESLEGGSQQGEVSLEPKASVSVEIISVIRKIPETPDDSNNNGDDSLRSTRNETECQAGETVKKEEGEDEQDTECIIVDVVKKNKKKKRKKKEEEEFVMVEVQEEEEFVATVDDGAKKKKKKKEEDVVKTEDEEREEEYVEVAEDGVKKKKKKKKRRKYDEENFVKIEVEEKEDEDGIETAADGVKKKKKKEKRKDKSEEPSCDEPLKKKK